MGFRTRASPMAVALITGARTFAGTSLPIDRFNVTASVAGGSKLIQVPHSRTRRSALLTEQMSTVGGLETGKFEKNREVAEKTAPKLLMMENDDVKRLSLRDYFQIAKDFIRSDGGPPRWFSPLECSSHSNNSPMLLYLPGFDGTGLGLVRHHQNLGKIFDIWCLHIPVMDQTPFEDLVKMVENTVRSEHDQLPSRPIYLVGESLGGCLALAVAGRNPDVDLVLILANPATSFSKSHLQHLIPLLEIMPDKLPLNLPHMASIISGNPLKMAMASIGTGFPLQELVGELTEDLIAMSSYFSVLSDNFSKEALLWKLQMLKAGSAFANSLLHAVKAQTLLLSSGKDHLLPSQEESKRLSRVLPNCQLRKFSNNGHFLFLEDGIDLVTIIKGAAFYRRSKYRDCVSDYMPPIRSELENLKEMNRLLSGVTSPVMLSTLKSGKIIKGLSGIPSEGPVLFVGNHMLFGIELISMMDRFIAERNILMRGLAHPMLFTMLLTRLKDSNLDISAFDIMSLMGAVPVSPSNMYKLLSSKSHVLLYPGGVREALHRKGEEYKLFWPEQPEFIRMAAKFGATIVPFGVMGEDDIIEILFDYDDMMKVPFLRAYIEDFTREVVNLRADAKSEVDQGAHTPLLGPKFPGRFYYYFGKPIETKGREKELREKELKGREASHELYLEVKSEVEKCLEYLKEKREKDPYRNILSRLAYQVTHGLTEEFPTFEL